MPMSHQDWLVHILHLARLIGGCQTGLQSQHLLLSSWCLPCPGSHHMTSLSLVPEHRTKPATAKKRPTASLWNDFWKIIKLKYDTEACITLVISSYKHVWCIISEIQSATPEIFKWVRFISKSHKIHFFLLVHVSYYFIESNWKWVQISKNRLNSIENILFQLTIDSVKLKLIHLVYLYRSSIE